jgi:hypothetical protein
MKIISRILQPAICESLVPISMFAQSTVGVVSTLTVIINCIILVMQTVVLNHSMQAVVHSIYILQVLVFEVNPRASRRAHGS